MMLSVKEGFLYMDNVHFAVFLWMVMSRNFIWLLDSGSAVNFMLGWSVLKSSCMFMMSVWRESKIIGMSSTYRKYAEMLFLLRSGYGVCLRGSEERTLLLVLMKGHPWPCRLAELGYSLYWRNSFVE